MAEDADGFEHAGNLTLGDLWRPSLDTVDFSEHARHDSIAAGRKEPEGTGDNDWADAFGYDAANHRARSMQSRLDHFVAQPEPEPVSDIVKRPPLPFRATACHLFLHDHSHRKRRARSRAGSSTARPSSHDPGSMVLEEGL